MSIYSFLTERENGSHTSSAYCRSRQVVKNRLEELAATPRVNQPCEFSGEPRATFLVDFSPNRSKVASTHGDHTVRVTDITSGKCTHILTGHPRTPWCLAFHPASDDILASGCLGGEVRIWDLRGGGSEVWKSGNNSVISSLTFHPSDHVLVFATSNTVYFWDWSKPEPFACCRTSYEYERVRWLRFDWLGHYLFTGICNNTTLQRVRVSNIVHAGDTSNRTGTGQVPNPNQLQLQANRVRYQQLLQSFYSFQREQQRQRLRHHAAEGYEVEGGAEQSEERYHRASPVHIDALNQAHAYASYVTEQSRENGGLHSSTNSSSSSQSSSTTSGSNSAGLAQRGSLSPPPRPSDDNADLSRPESDVTRFGVTRHHSSRNSQSLTSEDSRSTRLYTGEHLRVGSVARHSIGQSNVGDQNFMPRQRSRNCLWPLSAGLSDSSQFRHSASIQSRLSPSAPSSDLLGHSANDQLRLSPSAPGSDQLGPPAGAANSDLTGLSASQPSIIENDCLGQSTSASASNLLGQLTSATDSDRLGQRSGSTDGDCLGQHSGATDGDQLEQHSSATESYSLGHHSGATDGSQFQSGDCASDSMPAPFVLRRCLFKREHDSASVPGLKLPSSSCQDTSRRTEQVRREDCPQEFRSFLSGIVPARQPEAQFQARSEHAADCTHSTVSTEKSSENHSNVSGGVETILSEGTGLSGADDSLVASVASGRNSSEGETGSGSSRAADDRTGIPTVQDRPSSEDNLQAASMTERQTCATRPFAGVKRSYVLAFGAAQPGGSHSSRSESGQRSEGAPMLPSAAEAAHDMLTLVSSPVRTTQTLARSLSEESGQTARAQNSLATSEGAEMENHAGVSSRLCRAAPRAGRSGNIPRQTGSSAFRQVFPGQDYRVEPCSHRMSSSSGAICQICGHFNMDLLQSRPGFSGSVPSSSSASGAAGQVPWTASFPSTSRFAVSSGVQRSRSTSNLLLSREQRLGMDSGIKQQGIHGPRRFVMSDGASQTSGSLNMPEQADQGTDIAGLMEEMDEGNEEYGEQEPTVLNAELMQTGEDVVTSLDTIISQPLPPSTSIVHHPAADGGDHTYALGTDDDSVAAAVSGAHLAPEPLEPALSELSRARHVADSGNVAHVSLTARLRVSGTSAVSPLLLRSPSPEPHQPTLAGLTHHLERQVRELNRRISDLQDTFHTRLHMLYADRQRLLSSLRGAPYTNSSSSSSASFSSSASDDSVPQPDGIVGSANPDRPSSPVELGSPDRATPPTTPVVRPGSPERATPPTTPIVRPGSRDRGTPVAGPGSPGQTSPAGCRLPARRPRLRSSVLPSSGLLPCSPLSPGMSSFYPAWGEEGSSIAAPLTASSSATEQGVRNDSDSSARTITFTSVLSGSSPRPNVDSASRRGWGPSSQQMPESFMRSDLAPGSRARLITGPASTSERADPMVEVLGVTGEREFISYIELARRVANRDDFTVIGEHRSQGSARDTSVQEQPHGQHRLLETFLRNDRMAYSPSQSGPLPTIRVDHSGSQESSQPPAVDVGDHGVNEETSWHSLQQRHLHPHYSVSILDETINRPYDALQAAINRAIAGVFMSTGEQAVASNIVPQTHRIQRWDFRRCQIPDLTQSKANIVVEHCKLHNDASVELSRDASLLATFVPSHRGFPDSNILAVFSLKPHSFGQCLYTKSFGPNAISVSLSPENHFVLVGLAAKRLSWVYSPSQLVAQTYKLVEQNAGEFSMKHVSDVFHPATEGRSHVSVNSARWLPQTGGGIVYGTNQGDLSFYRAGVPEAPAESPAREDKQLLASSGYTSTIATQTGTGSIHRSAFTQTSEEDATSS